MYEMYTAKSDPSQHSYWLMNSSKEEDRRYMVSEIGVVFYAIEGTANEAGVRLVGYLDKNCKITTGDGTKEKPYTITK